MTIRQAQAFFGLVLCSIFVMTTNTAAAQDLNIPDETVNLLPGPTIGYGWRDGDAGGLILGAEVSVAYANLDEFVWAGFYSDLTYDFGGDSLRLSLGPEFGFSFFGFDAGLMVDDIFGGSPELGLSVRPVLSIFGVFSIYSRFTSGNEFATSFELGVTGKFPVPLDDR
ncbi:hypothetical protein FIV42_29140 [Persicimonas caeni]|uniref:Outer membrane protein beta-barrel domain-containing protein n=1 Tax=Persicimonas caeni TaxID=2292766 RepID=A0A4Y6Q232_PERCE|nr:hypothetical protein [Persicimonas caeni]QDG54661.1 hypothetical protein FIV42_29140 [Persicimonas caeni]QED35882.1 hypothetical protein FRD00_29135 [Persicimonas caeni]